MRFSGHSFGHAIGTALSSLVRPRLAGFGIVAVVMLTGLRASVTPSLSVVISIDQFRSDYLERFSKHFSKGGFRLLIDQGAQFTECRQKHSFTKTAPGHAVMLTGVYANVHGIIGNDWLDRMSFQRVSAVGDAAERILDVPPGESVGYARFFDNEMAGGCSPRKLQAQTVGDVLKSSDKQAKVIAISNKDRAAVLMGGRNADAAYFVVGGIMTTSTYYLRELPEWVTKWNSTGMIKRYFGRTWNYYLPASAYEVQGPDDVVGEDGAGVGLGRTFPKQISGGEDVAGTKFYKTLLFTPFSNEILADFAQAAIRGERLGQRAGASDILCLSFSSNDYIGHAYGPDSHEIMDNVVRLDRTLESLFEFLDRMVGLDRCTIVLVSDHGVAPMPEVTKSRHPEVAAERIDGRVLVRAGEEALVRVYGPFRSAGPLIYRHETTLFLEPTALKEKGINSVDAQRVVREELMKLNFVKAAYTREQLEAGNAEGMLGAMALLSFNRERSGDIFVQPAPWFLVGKPTGSTHGAPYDYDAHVPMLWYGVGVRRGVYKEPVGMEDLAPTLAKILKISSPPGGRGRSLF